MRCRSLAVGYAVLGGLLLAAPVRATHTLEKIQLLEESTTPGALAGPDIVVSPDGAHAYVASGPDDDSIAIYERDVLTDLLTPIDTVQDGVGGVNGLHGVSRVAISPDGWHLFATSTEDALSVFSREALTGLLTQIQVLRDGVDGVDGLHDVRAIVVSPDGAHVYVGRASMEVPQRGPAVFARDALTGLLSFVEVTPEASGIPSTGLALSPDGAQLFCRVPGTPSDPCRAGYEPALPADGVRNLFAERGRHAGSLQERAVTSRRFLGECGLMVPGFPSSPSARAPSPARRARAAP